MGMNSSNDLADDAPSGTLHWRRYGGVPNPDLRVHISLPKEGPVTHLVILCHGQTHSGGAMLRAARNDIRTLLPGAAIVAPDGYYIADVDQHLRARGNHAQKSFSWFDMPDGNTLHGRLRPGHQLARSIRPSVDYLHTIIDTHKERFSLTENKVLLVGFSQGGAVASQTAIERKESCGGVANLCGMFFDPLIFGMKEPVSKPPYFYGYDLGDEMVPDWLAYHTQSTLKRLGINALMHITPAGPLKETLVYDHRGHARMEWRPTPGAPLREFRKNFTHDSTGKVRISISEQVTGHYMNPGMRAALFHAVRNMDQAPLQEAPELGTTHLFDKLTPRVDMRRLSIGWMLMPRRERSTIPLNLRPMTAWQRMMYRGKRTLGDSFNQLARTVVRIASPLLFDIPDQLGEELRGKNKVTHLFTAIVLSSARVLIPKIFDLPPHLAERLRSTGQNEAFVEANDVNEMMGKDAPAALTPASKPPRRTFWKRPSR